MEEVSQKPRRAVYRRIGLTCLILILALTALSLPLNCTGLALQVGCVSLLSGAGLGAALAMVTRSHRPMWIYFWLAFAMLTFVPIFRGWPVADSFDIFPWHGAPAIVYNYFDILRAGVFLLAMPYPFAGLGQHGPDPLPSGEEKSS